MHVLVPPALAHGRICRVIAPIADLIEVQEWRGEYWLPSDLTLSAVRRAPRAPRHLLEAQAVPHEDWSPDDRDGTAPSAELLLLALLASAGAFPVGPVRGRAPLEVPAD